MTALSQPLLDAGKNAILRESVVVRGLFGRARFAVGELVPSFGDHPALLVSHAGRVDLVVPHDVVPLRTVIGISRIEVTVTPVTAVPSDGTGSVTLDVNGQPVILTSTQLAALPSRARTVSYLSGAGTATHTEQGPTLVAVLLAAGVLPTPGVLVTAVGTDGYGASVTMGESWIGGRPLLLSLTEDGVPRAQPRLVTVGDVKGGRYVSDVTVLKVDPTP